MPPRKGETTKEYLKRRMGEFSRGKMHSTSKHGPVVTNPKQAIAIIYSEARKGKRNV